MTPYRYIAFLHCGPDAAQWTHPDGLAEALQTMGMECRLSTDRIHLFTSSETPTRILPGRGLLVGRAFARHGDDLGHGPSTISRDTALDRHLLENFWGEYIAIDFSAPDEPIGILRDPSGGVPCVHSIHRGQGFLTSDVSIPARLGIYERRIDWDFIVHALAFPRLRTARTGLSGISELLPGCALAIGDRSTEVRTAWSPWEFVSSHRRHRNAADAIADVKRAVITAVTTWADVDRALLLELSGGLDSSIVAACLRETNARVVCCTLATPLPGTDERPYARHMSDLLDVGLNTLRIDVEAARFDFPIRPDSVAPGMGVCHYVSDAALSTAADAHAVHSHMSGAGGDTVFCYLGNASPAADALRERGLLAGLSAVQDLSDLYGCTVPKAARLTLRKLIRGAREARPANTTFLAPSADAPTPMPHPWLDVPGGVLIGDQERIGALIGTQGYVDGMTRNRQRPVRSPLLSQPVVEACLRVPTWMWISGGRNRSIARDAFADVLPPYILNRRSKGTYVSFAGAIYASHRMKALQFLENGHLSANNLLDLPALRRFLKSDAPPKDTFFFRIFDLCMIENWIRHQGVADRLDSAAATPVPPRCAESLIARQTSY